MRTVVMHAVLFVHISASDTAMVFRMYTECYINRLYARLQLNPLKPAISPFGFM